MSILNLANSLVVPVNTTDRLGQFVVIPNSNISNLKGSKYEIGRSDVSGGHTAPIEGNPSSRPAPSIDFGSHSGEVPHAGALIINADDWGRDRENTDHIFECITLGTVSSVSAMVFMEDSERAAEIARESEVDAGLHVNFTTPFSGTNGPTRLIEHQRRLCRYLRRHRLAQVLFHPGLMDSFEYVIRSQIDEFARLYGAAPERIDGHHHMHLCANVVLGRLLPSGTVVRRHFTFQPGEKGFCNRTYRQLADRMLRRRHRLTDFLFALPPLNSPDHLERIFSLARRFVVEIETHPVNPMEYQFLMGGEVFHWTRDIPIAHRFAVPQFN
jgi:predicted glycoside hydrolase/deacetylase ChbG (UPF0249 family)